MRDLRNYFAPYIGPPGLLIAVNAGELLFSGASVIIPATTVILLANATNYVFLNTSTAGIQSNTSGFPSSNCYPLATVLTGTTGIVALVDNRPDVSPSGSSGASSLTRFFLTPTGDPATYTLAIPFTANAMVFRNGVLLFPTSDYTTTGSSITFVTTPSAGDNLIVME